MQLTVSNLKHPPGVFKMAATNNLQWDVVSHFLLGWSKVPGAWLSSLGFTSWAECSAHHHVNKNLSKCLRYLLLYPPCCVSLSSLPVC